MTKAAVRVVELPGEADKALARRSKKARMAELRGKTFEALTSEEKDALLKELAILAGLIDDSDGE